MKRVHNKLKNTNQAEYQTWVFGVTLTFMFYILLFLFGPASIALPIWAWYIGIIYLVSGVILYFGTNRVLWIRYFQFVGTSLIALTALVLELSLFWQEFSVYRLSLVIGALLLVLGGNIFLGYDQIKRQGPEFGYGYMGSLNVKTGLLNPTKTPNLRKSEIESGERLLSNWRRLSPLVAGLSMFLVNILSIEGMKIYLAIVGMLALWLGTFGIGRMSYFIFWITQWEERENKKILVER